MVRYEVRDAVAIVTLDRPEKLNALTVEMREALATCFAQAANDGTVRAVLLQSSGKAFCASGDVSRMAEFTPESGRAVLALAHRMIRNLVAIDKPVVCATRGAVAGIGWSLALACDLVIASTTARFSLVFRHVGLVPDGGAVWFLTQHLGTLQAKELVFSGRRVEASEALALGLVTKVVADDDLDAYAWQTAFELAAGPTLALGMSKRMFRMMHSPDLESLLAAEAWSQSVALQTEDHREGVRAFLEKRPSVFKGR